MAETLENTFTISDTEQQKERAILREDYLRTLKTLTNRPVKIKMYENIKLNGTFKSFHPDGSKFLFVDAQLPTCSNPCSILLRSADIISVTFPGNFKK